MSRKKAFIIPPAEHPDRRFADQAAWERHLERLGLTGLRVTPDPVCIATEGAFWRTIQAHGFLHQAVVLSDDAGQFDVGDHALCWVHADPRVEEPGGWCTSWMPSPTTTAPDRSKSAR